MRFGLALAAVAAAGLAAAPAAAQYYRPRGPVYAPPAYSTYGAAYGGYCVKMCPQDVTPCDPPEFKRTDGRCANPFGGSVR